MVFKIDEVLLFFAAYAIMGWISEVIFAALKTGRFVNRGFLNSRCALYTVLALWRWCLPLSLLRTA